MLAQQAENDGLEAMPRDVSRLVYGYAGGRHHGPRRTALAIATARGIDKAMARLRFVEPALLVSGFWRSGTTWLQESLASALGGKTVFEPLSPMEPRRRAALTRLHPYDTEDVCQATIPGPQPQNDAFWSDLDQACTGKCTSSYHLSCRQRIVESFRRTIVIKDVRLQANLVAFHDRYGLPIVHIRRHPCAVVASFMTADWHWSFARAPLAILLPRFSTSLTEIERGIALQFDTDKLSRIAAFWATTERVAAAALQGQRWGLVLFYEHFAMFPEETLSRSCEMLGLRQKHAVDFSAPSASIDPAAFASHGSSPADKWRNQLTLEEIARVEAVVDAIYPTWRAEFRDYVAS